MLYSKYVSLTFDVMNNNDIIDADYLFIHNRTNRTEWFSYRARNIDDKHSHKQYKSGISKSI